MITKATKSKVTTTPMRIPKTGVNSNGTGDSEKGKTPNVRLYIGMSTGYPGPGISRDIPGSKNPGTKKSRDFDS